MQNSNDHKQIIQQGFDTVAAGYDHSSLSFFPETAKRLVDHLQLNPTDHLLDVCTGTGCVALTAAEKLTQGKVTGIDLSSGMLQQAKNKAAEQGFSNTQFKQMDLDHLEFQGDTFDVATSSFGLFFIEDMTNALHNISRCTTAKDGGSAGNAGAIGSAVRPGGKVAITTFTGDAFSPMADIFIKRFESTGRAVPPLSWQRVATEELIKEQFNKVGITNISICHEPLGYQMTDPQMWWDVVWNAGWRSLLTNFTRTKIERVSAAHRANYMDVICNQMSEEEQKEFEEVHREEISGVLGSDGVWFNTEVLTAVWGSY